MHGVFGPVCEGAKPGMLSGTATADVDAVGAGFSGLNATRQQRNRDQECSVIRNYPVVMNVR
jgi:hypothetical protein